MGESVMKFMIKAGERFIEQQNFWGWGEGTS
jgi:hypothetical protein